MAINKDKKIRIDITLYKQDYERLIKIQNELSESLQIDLNKSQVIGFIIRNFENTPKQKESKPNKATKGNINYQAQILALKDKLNVSYPRLSAIIGISASTLKKYASGQQAPKDQNERLLNDSLKRYGIK